MGTTWGKSTLIYLMRPAKSYIRRRLRALLLVKESDKLAWETTLSKLLLPLSERGSTLKRKNLAHLGADSSLLEQTPFQRGFVCRKANMKS